MGQMTLDLTHDSLGDIKERIEGLWVVLDYENGNHKRNSLFKHLGVRSLSECDHRYMLLNYEEYLEEKKDE